MVIVRGIKCILSLKIYTCYKIHLTGVQKRKLNINNVVALGETSLEKAQPIQYRRGQYMAIIKKHSVKTTPTQDNDTVLKLHPTKIYPAAAYSFMCSFFQSFMREKMLQ